METSTLKEKIKLLSHDQRLRVEGYVDALLDILEEEKSLADNSGSEKSGKNNADGV